MLTLLIIADDFTGALDTGVQFATNGANTRVVTSANYDFRQVDSEVQVLVIDAETRHLSNKEAYDIVYDITKRAVKQKIPYLYKKTDSALRGNIGSELTAMLEAAGANTLSFLPAFPKMDRFTKDGIHYIDGVPVQESVFGKDPFDPVTCSNIQQLIAHQSQVKTHVKSLKDLKVSNEEGNKENQKEPEILIWDAKTDEELKVLGQHLYESDQMYLTAGCAGFASVLPELLAIKKESTPDIKLIPKILVICGSVNPITVSQIDYAQKHGFQRIRLKPEERLNHEFFHSSLGQEKLCEWKEVLKKHPCVIFDSNDLPGQEDTKDYAKAHGLSTKEIRVRIASSYGYILKELLSGEYKTTLMITGGDTLLGCMEQLGVREMEPVCELAPGTVLSRFFLEGKTNQVISKSGGFGEETLIMDLANKIIGKT